RVENWGCATRAASCPRSTAPPQASRLATAHRSPHGHLANPAYGQHGRESLPQVALQDDQGAIGRTTAAERLLELAAPALALLAAQPELVHDGDFLAAASLALEPDHGPRGWWRRLRLRLRRLGLRRHLVAKCLEHDERILLPILRHLLRTRFHERRAR